MIISIFSLKNNLPSLGFRAGSCPSLKNVSCVPFIYTNNWLQRVHLFFISKKRVHLFFVTNKWLQKVHLFWEIKNNYYLTFKKHILCIFVL